MLKVVSLPVQAKLFEADTQWFHVFKSMIESGELANISGSAIKVYLVIKSHSNYKSGKSFPSEETMAEKSGLSVSQVKRCVKELKELAYLSVTKQGRKNHYMLKEKVSVRNEKGNSTAQVTWDYIPGMVADAVEELKNYVKTGHTEKTQIIHIENLQLNINQVGNGGVVLNNQVFDLSNFDPKMQEQVRGFLAKAGIQIPQSYTQLTDDTCHG